MDATDTYDAVKKLFGIKFYENPQNLDELSCSITKIIYNDPATIVFWEDGSKTVVKCHGKDTYEKYVGLAMCIIKKYFGNNRNLGQIFEEWT